MENMKMARGGKGKVKLAKIAQIRPSLPTSVSIRFTCLPIRWNHTAPPTPIRNMWGVGKRTGTDMRVCCQKLPSPSLLLRQVNKYDIRKEKEKRTP